jgi:hypothetical protein
MSFKRCASASAAVVVVIVAACGVDSAATVLVTRDTLANGAELVRYGSLPAPSDSALAPDLHIGKVEGEPHEIFGDVRGVEADSGGDIYILDAQSSEVRVYDANGQYLRTLTRNGGGPSEITESNGMVFGSDGTLWVEDHGRWQMMGITADGVEVARHPMPVLSYGYIFSGAVDDRGRFWQMASHEDEDLPRPPPLGVIEGASRMYAKFLDPATGRIDSIFVSEQPYRTYIAQRGSGYRYYPMPFTGRAGFVFDPAGGLWAIHRASYRIYRLNESADTTLIIEADIPALPVTDEDKAKYAAGIVESSPDQRRAADELVALAPPHKPVLDMLFLDDEGNVWVRRVAPDGESPQFDIFAADGAYLASTRLGFTPAPYLPPRIRNGNLYALVTDSLDVPTVVRAPLPALQR